MTQQNEQRVRVVIEAVDRASQTIKSISGRITAELTRLGRRMVFLGAIVSGFAGVAVRAAASQREAMLQLEFIVRATSQSWDAHRAHVEDVIAEWAKASKFSKKDLAEALAVAVQETGNLDFAMRALPAAAALASGAGMTVQQAMQLITKAIMGDDGSMKQLEKLGIHVSTKLPGQMAEGGGSVKLLTNPFDVLTEITLKYGEATEKANPPSAQLAKSLGEMFATIGDSLEPAIKPFVAAVGDIANLIEKWAKEHPKLTAAIAKGAATLMFVLPIVAALALTIAALSTVLAFLIPLVLALAGPFGAFAVAVILVIAVIIRHKDKLKMAWEDFKDFWKLLNEIMEGDFKAVWDRILANARDYVTRIRDAWAEKGPELVSFWKDVWDEIVRNTIEQVNQIINTINRIPLLPNIPTIPTPSVPQRGSSGGHPISAGEEAALSTIPASLAAQFRAVHMLQEGGIVRQPTMAVIGEHGPEAVIPLGRHGTMAGGLVVNINAQGAIIGMDEFKTMVIKAVRDAASGGGFNYVLRGR